MADVFGVEVGAFQERRRDSVLRGAASRCLCRYAGLTQREAAGVLRVGSGAAISHQLKNLAEELPKNGRLSRRLDEAERRLKAKGKQGAKF